MKGRRDGENLSHPMPARGLLQGMNIWRRKLKHLFIKGCFFSLIWKNWTCQWKYKSKLNIVGIVCVKRVLVKWEKYSQEWLQMNDWYERSTLKCFWSYRKRNEWGLHCKMNTGYKTEWQEWEDDKVVIGGNWWDPKEKR